MNYGLSEATIRKIHSVLRQFPEIEQAILFGSRAKGCAKSGSDIDLTLVGEIDERSVWKVADVLDDLLLPYQFSLSAFSSLKLSLIHI